MSHLLRPITDVSASESDSSSVPAAPVQPVKKRKIIADGSTPAPVSFAALFGQACDCSRKRKRTGESCFLKLQEQKPALETMREHLNGLHKLDQDQLVLW